MYAIEHDIPLPTPKGKPHCRIRKGRKGGRVYNFEAMEVGDSFLVTDRDQLTVTSACNAAEHRFPGRQYITRKVREVRGGALVCGIRVWRLR